MRTRRETICPECGEPVEDELDQFWLNRYGLCARCDRKQAAAAVLRGYNATREENEE